MSEEIKKGQEVHVRPARTWRKAIVVEIYDKPKAYRVVTRGLKPEEWLVTRQDISTDQDVDSGNEI